MRLDNIETFPSGMKEYLEMYGWHFSKKMCDWAASNMYKTIDGKKVYIDKITREIFDAMKERYSIEIKAKGYDDVYLANMCKADYLGSSIPNELHLVKYVKDSIGDPDAYEGMTFTRFYADCIGSGTPISWEDMI